MSNVLRLRASVVVATGLLASASHGAIVQAVSGVSSAGVPFSFEAEFAISGDNLSLTLRNTSPVHSQNPNDLFSSFYFDIVNGLNQRPALNYSSATADVWLTDRDAADTLQTANANIRAVVAGDNSWQFRTFDSSMAPFLGFGVGTVGNSNLNPNGFNGNIVDGMDYSIYAGDVTTANLHNRQLVKNSAVFHFTGLTGFSEGDISMFSAFGLGTAPDSVTYNPAPGTGVLLMIGGLAAARRRRGN
jgi:hypothetical protein